MKSLSFNLYMDRDGNGLGLKSDQLQPAPIEGMFHVCATAFFVKKSGK